MTEKSNFYFTVHSFMTRELGLRGSQLMIYAIIYAFSKDGKGAFYGTLDFLSKNAGICASSVLLSLKNLLNKDLICTDYCDTHIRKKYWINTEKIKPHFLHTNTSKIEDPDHNFYKATPQKFKTETVNFEDYNKYNNKYNNKSIFNLDKGAKAQKKEKKKENSFGDVPYFDNSDQVAIHQYLASFIPEDKHTREGNRQTNSSAVGYNAGKHQRSEQQSYKYCAFDPEEAFREATRRTEELFQSMNDRADTDS